MGFDPSDEAERLRRYEQSSGRDFYRAINTLTTIRRSGLDANPPATATGAEPAAPLVEHPDEHVPPATATGIIAEPPAPAADPEETPSLMEPLATACAAATPPCPEVNATGAVNAGREVHAAGETHAVRAVNVARVPGAVWAVLAIWAAMVACNAHAARDVERVRDVHAVPEVHAVSEGEAPAELFTTPRESPLAASPAGGPQGHHGGVADSSGDKSNPIPETPRRSPPRNHVRDPDGSNGDPQTWHLRETGSLPGRASARSPARPAWTCELRAPLARSKPPGQLDPSSSWLSGPSTSSRSPRSS
jgi:hypothetical protein